MAVSYLSRLVIVHAIASRLGQRPTATRKPRVFVMGAPGHGQTGNLNDLNAEKAYRVMTAHLNTVAGNEMLVLDAAERYPAPCRVRAQPRSGQEQHPQQPHG